MPFLRHRNDQSFLEDNRRLQEWVKVFFRGRRRFVFLFDGVETRSGRE